MLGAGWWLAVCGGWSCVVMVVGVILVVGGVGLPVGLLMQRAQELHRVGC